MIEVGAASGIATVIALVTVSFFSFLTGVIFRKWPDKVQAYAEGIDGFALFLSPEGNRAMIELCGLLLIVMSFVALVAAAIVA